MKHGKLVRRYWGCLKCHKELDRTQGEWVRAFKNKHVHGYFIPPSICPWIEPKYLLKLYRELKRPKIFYNFHLGLPWEGGAGTITREDLLKCKIDLAPEVSPRSDDDIYYLGVDQGDVLHWELSRAHHGRRCIVNFGVARSFDEISALIQRFNVRACMLDAMPNKHSARELQKKHWGRVWLVYYKDLPHSEINEFKEGTKDEFTLIIDRTESLDSSAAEWQQAQALICTPEGTIIAEEAFDQPRAKNGWLQQMCNMKRDTIQEEGKEEKVVWRDTGADHYRHADNYNFVAFKKFPPSTGDVQLGPLPRGLVSSKPGEILPEAFREILDEGYEEDEQMVFMGSNHLRYEDFADDNAFVRLGGSYGDF